MTREVTENEEATAQLGYYDRPVLKEPAWIWSVPVYFQVGGAAGAAAVLGAAAEAIDRDRYEDLAARCRWIALAGTAAGGALLIHDLGRPARFLNMLRVFRPTSALNMGSWVLAAAGAADSAAVLFPRSRLLSFLSGLIGLPEAGYTAVLLADTAVPVWQETRRSMPGFFVALAASSAADVLSLADLDPASHRAVRTVAIGAGMAEVATASAVEREAKRVPRVGLPFERGLSGSLWKTYKVAGIASLLVSLLPLRGRAMRWIAGLLGLLGGTAARFAIFHAGFASARDPQATFAQQSTVEG